MARKVEFESERWEKRKNARRYWVPAVVLLAMIIVAVVVALLTRSDRGGTFIGENTPYPYTWTEEKDGTVTFELDTTDSEGYQWVITDASDEVVVLEADGNEAKPNESGEPTILTVQADKKQPENKLRLVLRPESDGRAVFTLSLLNETAPDERIAEFSVLTEIRSNGKKLNAYLISAGGRVYQGTVGGEGTNYDYIAQMNEYGNCVLTVISKLPVQEAEVEAEEQTPENGEEDNYIPTEEEERAEGIIPIDELAERMEETDEEPEEEILYFGYTLEEFMSLPLEVRDELFAEQQAIEDALEAEEAAADPQPKGWECVSDNEAVVEVLDLVYTAEGNVAYLMPGEEPGSATVRMTSPDSTVEVTLVCEVDANGDFHIKSHSIRE